MSLEESIRTLLSYSLIKREAARMIALAPTLWFIPGLGIILDSKAQREKEIARRAFETLQWAIDVPGQQSTDDWIFEQRVMLHIDAVANHIFFLLSLFAYGVAHLESSFVKMHLKGIHSLLSLFIGRVSLHNSVCFMIHY